MIHQVMARPLLPRCSKQHSASKAPGLIGVDVRTAHSGRHDISRHISITPGYKRKRDGISGPWLRPRTVRLGWYHPHPVRASMAPLRGCLAWSGCQLDSLTWTKGGDEVRAPSAPTPGKNALLQRPIPYRPQGKSSFPQAGLFACTPSIAGFVPTPGVPHGRLGRVEQRGGWRRLNTRHRSEKEALVSG